MSKQDESKITKLNTEYAKEQYAQFQKQHRQVVFKRRRMAFILAISLVVFAFVGFGLFRDYQRLQSLNKIKAESKVEATAAKEQVVDLQHTVKLLKDDDYVAKLARSKFFYSKDGEQIFVLPDNLPTKDSTDSTSDDAKGSAVKDAETVIESNQGD